VNRDDQAAVTRGVTYYMAFERLELTDPTLSEVLDRIDGLLARLCKIAGQIPSSEAKGAALFYWAELCGTRALRLAMAGASLHIGERAAVEKATRDGH
jgi:hypothetical protein